MTALHLHVSGGYSLTALRAHCSLRALWSCTPQSFANYALGFANLLAARRQSYYTGSSPPLNLLHIPYVVSIFFARNCIALVPQRLLPKMCRRADPPSQHDSRRRVNVVDGRLTSRSCTSVTEPPARQKLTRKHTVKDLYKKTREESDPSVRRPSLEGLEIARDWIEIARDSSSRCPRSTPPPRRSSYRCRRSCRHCHRHRSCHARRRCCCR